MMIRAIHRKRKTILCGISAGGGRTPQSDNCNSRGENCHGSAVPGGIGLQGTEPDELLDQPLPPVLAEAGRVLKEQIFKDCADIVFQDLLVGGRLNGLLVHTHGLSDTDLMADNVVRPLLYDLGEVPAADLSPRRLAAAGVGPGTGSTGRLFRDVVTAALDGQAALLIEGHAECLIFEVKGGKRRNIEEPPSEVVVRGPREGFNEDLSTSVSLLRTRLRTPRLKTVQWRIGAQTRTRVVLVYLDQVANPALITEVKRRLDNIRIDGVLESGYIESFLEDQPWSPFPQMLYSERPDTVAAMLLEGRCAIVTDGTPFALIAPITFWQFFKTSEDYYERFLIGSFLRALRMTFGLVALFLPALYVAVITFHQDMLPTSLMLSIASAREAIPFPALVEATMMELSFEALREAGVRLPKTVGQAVSILGALVIGQAAVEAGIVSAPMVIIVSLTGIASFTIPHFNGAISLRLLRFPLMLLAGIFGLVGIVLGALWTGIHLCSLRSFGLPYLTGVAPFDSSDAKDILVRAPWWAMVRRPSGLWDANRQRMPPGQKPEAPPPRR